MSIRKHIVVNIHAQYDSQKNVKINYVLKIGHNHSFYVKFLHAAW